jgi:hypothetical protein
MIRPLLSILLLAGCDMLPMPAGHDRAPPADLSVAAPPETLPEGPPQAQVSGDASVGPMFAVAVAPATPGDPAVETVARQAAQGYCRAAFGSPRLAWSHGPEAPIVGTDAVLTLTGKCLG